jgi:hypothetical protein
MTSPKHPRPAHVRPRVGRPQAISDKLKQSQDYLSAQASADPQKKLDDLAIDLSQKRTTVLEMLQQRADLKAKLDVVQAGLVVAVDEHDAAVRAYAHGAAKVAGKDASMLTTLGVAVAGKPTRGASEAVDAPAAVEILPGVSGGDARLRCESVAHAGAYEFQYKLEPAGPSDPWQTAGITKRVSIPLPGLPTGQKIRARARAIGATPGPWSDEAFGDVR